jgi:glycosyltransferase involved in cell wall biosynthesis
MTVAVRKRIAILGTVGVPASYGGFETLAENLVKYHDVASLPDSVTVYCSSRSYPLRKQDYLSAQLRYVPLNANGAQSILYDIVSLLSAAWNRNDVILLLGVSGAIALPLVRFFSSARIITNIDGIEWRRDKWRGLAKWWLRFSEKMAVYFSHEVIADNDAIAEYVKQTYGVNTQVIAYGGDHAMAVEAVAVVEFSLPASYAFSVCRIEPENNVHMVLEAFSKLKSQALVMVGNWNNSEYGRGLRERYDACKHLYLLDPIYDLGKLKSLRSQASFIVHGHSAGGTNPALVEAMHFGKPVLAYDCSYNRSTTEDKALFFKSSAELARLLETIEPTKAEEIGRKMREIANRRYTWKVVADEYFSLLTN